MVQPLDKPAVFLPDALILPGVGKPQKGDDQTAAVNGDTAASICAGEFSDLSDHAVLDPQEGVLHLDIIRRSLHCAVQLGRKAKIGSLCVHIVHTGNACDLIGGMELAA